MSHESLGSKYKNPLRYYFPLGYRLKISSDVSDVSYGIV